MSDLGTLERRSLRDVFVVNMSNKEAQTELCRSTKTQYEVYRIALGRGDKYAKTYNVSDGGLAAAPARALQIKTEPISAIRGGYRRLFQRDGSGAGRTNNRGGADRKCFNCDQSGFTPDPLQSVRREMPRVFFVGNRALRTHMPRPQSGRARTCKFNHEDATEGDHHRQEQDENTSICGNSVGWVTTSLCQSSEKMRRN